MASVHVEASPLTSHEAHLGVRQSQEWRQPGQQACLIRTGFRLLKQNLQMTAVYFNLCDSVLLSLHL